MINFAHRGYSSRYPENTLLSFKEAINVGADAIELDVHKTKDNVLVVIHDEKVNRTHRGKGYVKDYTLEELQRLKHKSIKYYFNRETVIPTLEEVLNIFKSNKMLINIEIKNDKISYQDIEQDVINMVKKYNMQSRIILSSFNHNALIRCKEIDSTIQTGMLYSKPIKNIGEYARRFKVDALHPSALLVNEEYIKEAHKYNLKVNTYTVNVPEMMEMLKKWNIDGIITDCPQELKAII